MLKRLGMWNRLALVIFALTLIASPMIAGTNYVREMSALREAGLELCRRSNAGTGKEDFEGYLKRDTECFDRFTQPIPSAGWAFYADATMWGGILFAIAYVLTWIAVVTIKWILRGREASDHR